MKILHISKLFPPFFGGIETVAYDTAIESKLYGLDVDVLCVSENNKSNMDIVDGITVFRCSSFAHLASTYLSISFLFKWLSIRNNYDIIHVHLPNPLAMVALFFIRSKAKIIIHWHSDIVKQRILKIPFMPLQHWLLNKCDIVIVTSPNYAKYSNDLFAYINKTRVIPIGISDANLHVDESLKNHIKEKYRGKKIVFSLGRHIYYKGFEYLVSAAKFLPDDFVVLIGGVGELTDSLNRQISDEGLNDKVVLLGKIPFSHLGTYYDICDVFCLPSIERSEAFGVVQLEAMSFGKPVVSTDIEGSGVPWVNRHKKTGLIAPVKNAQALAKCIIEAASFDLTKSNYIKDYFNSDFRREKMVNSIIALYKEVYC